MTLDEIALLEGTDKSSLNHDYLRHYAAALVHLRDRQINVLELGVQGGQSLRMWRRWFNQATIIGVDMNPQCKRHEDDRIKVFIGAQDDADLLARICDQFPPTVIIDDASHRGGETVASLEFLFPRLARAGVYIIEDLFVHYTDRADEWRTYAPDPMPDYLARFAHHLFATRRGAKPEHYTEGPEFLDDLDWLSIANSTVIMRKKTGRRPDFLRVRNLLAANNGSAVAWDRLHESIMRLNGPVDIAEHAIREAIEIDPTVDRFHWALSRALQRRGDHAGALAEAEAAHRLAPTETNTRRLAKLHQVHAEPSA